MEEARLAVQAHEIAGAGDVGGPDGGEEVDRQPPGAHRLRERAPDVPERRRVLVGERDEVDPVGAVQPMDLDDQPLRVAVPPLDPGTVLAAMGAAMGVAARELHDGRPRPEHRYASLRPINSHPTRQASRSAIGDRRQGARQDHVPAVPEGGAGDATKVGPYAGPAGLRGLHDLGRRRLTLPRTITTAAGSPA